MEKIIKGILIGLAVIVLEEISVDGNSHWSEPVKVIKR